MSCNNCAQDEGYSATDNADGDGGFLDEFLPESDSISIGGKTVCLKCLIFWALVALVVISVFSNRRN
jgi:hypothetical protein